jgi:DNA polymerase
MGRATGPITMIHLDFETYSEIDLRRVGAYRYAADPSTEVLIMCYSFGDGPVREWVQGDPLPTDLMDAVRDGQTLVAHNAEFEYCIWNLCLRRRHKEVPAVRIAQLNCTAVRSAAAGLPRGLDGAGRALRLPIQKDKAGRALVQLFCKPRKPTKKDPSTRVRPQDAPEKFREFVRYCKIDVMTERGIDKRVPQLSRFDQVAFEFNRRMNNRGVPLDVEMVEHAAVVVLDLQNRAKAKAREITGGINPTQNEKLKAWMALNDVDVANLQAKTLHRLLLSTDIQLTPEMRELLNIRVDAAKASVTKLQSMARCAMFDDRARGTVMVYGAHTGRDSGKLIQPQNFIRGLPDLEAQIALMERVFSLLPHRDADVFEMLFPAAITVIGQCMRGFIKAKHGHRLVVGDYAQIEARVLVWYARCMHAIQDYVEGKDRYKVMAAFLYGIPEAEVSKEQRRIGKNLVLGCGFGLGDKKFIDYCAKEDLIIELEMSTRAVYGFRELHEEVVQFWEDVERCAKGAVRHPGQVIVLRNLKFYMKDIWLCIELPTGRCLRYPYPQVKEREKTYTRKDGTKRTRLVEELSFLSDWNGKLLRETTYGGKLVENIVQATARDIMVVGALNLEKHQYDVILPVHDELLTEMPRGKGSVQEMEHLMARMPKWTTDLPVRAEGFEVERYRKG